MKYPVQFFEVVGPHVYGYLPLFSARRVVPIKRESVGGGGEFRPSFSVCLFFQLFLLLLCFFVLFVFLFV